MAAVLSPAGSLLLPRDGGAPPPLLCQHQHLRRAQVRAGALTGHVTSGLTRGVLWL